MVPGGGKKKVTIGRKLRTRKPFYPSLLFENQPQSITPSTRASPLPLPPTPTPVETTIDDTNVITRPMLLLIDGCTSHGAQRRRGANAEIINGVSGTRDRIGLTAVLDARHAIWCDTIITRKEGVGKQNHTPSPPHQDCHYLLLITGYAGQA